MNNSTDKICPCGTPRWMTIAGESNRELYNITLDGTDKRNVLIPSHINMGEHEIIWFTFCLNCGRIHGEWPVRQEIVLSEEYTDESNDDSDDNATPLTEELKTIIAKDYYGFKICDTHFDEKL